MSSSRLFGDDDRDRSLTSASLIISGVECGPDMRGRGRGQGRCQEFSIWRAGKGREKLLFSGRGEYADHRSRRPAGPKCFSSPSITLSLLAILILYPFRSTLTETNPASTYGWMSFVGFR